MENINFQPIPKRFMVWDKGNQKFMYFIDDDGYERFMVDISELYVLIEEYGYSYEDVVIIQSTNLFDKDGKEIFEGSVVENTFINNIGYVYYDEYVAGWRILYKDGKWDDLYYVRSDIVTTGYILSNPELMEEKDV